MNVLRTERRKWRRDGQVGVSTNDVIIAPKIFLLTVSIEVDAKLPFEPVTPSFVSNSKPETVLLRFII